jgi:UDP-glucose 4-epimerase
VKRVAVVGGAGFIGRATVAALARTGAEAVIVDRVRASGVHPIDITAPEAEERLARVFEGSAAVIHLAARVNPPTPKERDAARRLHIDGTQAVARAVRRAGVGRIVLASSATVYGAWPENPVPIEETCRLRPNADFAYAEDKAAQEAIVLEESGDALVAVARPAIVYGPGARSYLTELLRVAPVLPALDGRMPPLQFVHVDDVARALVHLASGADVGPFNVSSADWLAFEDVARLRGRRTLPVPKALIAPALDALSRVVPPHLRAPASMLPYLMYPFVVSPARLIATGWAPRSSSRDALLSL